jgi:hypothetical protein
MALERLQRCVPIFLYFWFHFNPRWDILLKLTPNNTLLWRKNKR